MIRNHGVFAAAPDVLSALAAVTATEEAARVTVLARAAGGEPPELDGPPRSPRLRARGRPRPGPITRPIGRERTRPAERSAQSNVSEPGPRRPSTYTTPWP